jgi:nitrate/nitrite-specific signal transduction histidine kinase
VFKPLNNIRIKALNISKEPQCLGDQIEPPASRELADLTTAFNDMSTRLQQERHKLETRVQERTKDLNDVNFRLAKEVDDHRKTIATLGKSLKEIKTLRGILPICCNCKRIRSDEGIWQQIESYIEAHSEADFSHSICPECRKKLYPDIY